MYHIDFINNYDGDRITLAAFCQEYAQWEEKHLGINSEGDDYEYPVLRKDGNEGSSFVLIHTEGALFVFPQVEGHWDYDPDLELILEEYS